LVREQHDAAARDYLLGVQCARTHISSSSCGSGFEDRRTGAHAAVNLIEIDMSSYQEDEENLIGGGGK
jgi:hypothetical protein